MCFVSYESQANSLPEGIYAEFGARDVKATSDPPEAKRRCLIKVPRNVIGIATYCFSCHILEGEKPRRFTYIAPT